MAGSRRPHALWQGPAFGLDLESTVPIPGLLPTRSSVRGKRVVRIDTASLDELAADWRPAEAERISRYRTPGGGAVLRIHAHPRLGFDFKTRDFGRFRASAEGRLVRCAPRPISPWRWQRYLTGQVLPLVALVRGLEVFHASAVALEDRVIAFVGDSGAGKSTVALNLMLRGARFLTDDVLALEAEGDGVLAHPGVGIAKLRQAGAERLPPGADELFGRVVGKSVRGTWMAVENRCVRPLPLAAMYFLEPRPGVKAPSVEEMRPVDPLLLLASTFNSVIRSPARLMTQLDVCARVSQSAGLFRVVLPPTAPGPDTAALLQEHALGLAAA